MSDDTPPDPPIVGPTGSRVVASELTSSRVPAAFRAHGHGALRGWVQG